MKIVIEKKIQLDFLGDKYKDAQLTFRGLSLKEYEDQIDKVKKLENQEGKEKEAVVFIGAVLKDHFINGEFPDESGKLGTVLKEDLDQLDIDTIFTVFRRLTGQELPPKV